MVVVCIVSDNFGTIVGLTLQQQGLPSVLPIVRTRHGAPSECASGACELRLGWSLQQQHTPVFELESEEEGFTTRARVSA